MGELAEEELAEEDVAEEASAATANTEDIKAPPAEWDADNPPTIQQQRQPGSGDGFNIPRGGRALHIS